jgi:hypothetical protein
VLLNDVGGVRLQNRVCVIADQFVDVVHFRCGATCSSPGQGPPPAARSQARSNGPPYAGKIRDRCGPLDTATAGLTDGGRYVLPCCERCSCHGPQRHQQRKSHRCRFMLPSDVSCFRPSGSCTNYIVVCVPGRARVGNQAAALPLKSG